MQETCCRGKVSKIVVTNIEITETATNLLALKTWTSCWRSTLSYHGCNRWRTWGLLNHFLGLGYFMSAFFGAFLCRVVLLVLVPETEIFKSFLSCLHYLSFFFLIFMDNWLDHWELFDGLDGVPIIDWAFSGSFCYFLAINFNNCLPWEQRWSRSRLLVAGILVLASAFIDFLTRLSQASGFYSFSSILSWINGQRSLWKYFPKKTFKREQLVLNSFKIDWRCLRWVVQSWTSFN